MPRTQPILMKSINSPKKSYLFFMSKSCEELVDGYDKQLVQVTERHLPKY